MRASITKDILTHKNYHRAGLTQTVKHLPLTQATT